MLADSRFQSVINCLLVYNLLQAYFSGHDKQFGHDFCVRLFGRLDDPPNQDQFVTVMKDVEEICKC